MDFLRFDGVRRYSEERLVALSFSMGAIFFTSERSFSERCNILLIHLMAYDGFCRTYDEHEKGWVVLEIKMIPVPHFQIFVVIGWLGATDLEGYRDAIVDWTVVSVCNRQNFVDRVLSRVLVVSSYHKAPALVDLGTEGMRT